jgi:hypothetical protein
MCGSRSGSGTRFFSHFDFFNTFQEINLNKKNLNVGVIYKKNRVIYTNTIGLYGDTHYTTLIQSHQSRGHD